jgi:hypothetical protein
MTDKVESLLDAVSRQRAQLGTKGILDLSTKIKFPPGGLASLNFPRLKTLNLSNLPLKSLETLAAHPNLKMIIADNSQVEVLKGLGSHPCLTSLSLVGAPVAQAANFRLAALILIPKLSSINREPVTAGERHLSESYPPIAKQLVNVGWIVQYPPPSEADFRYLAGHFGVNGSDADFVLPPVTKSKTMSPPSSPPQRETGGQERWSQKVAGILASLGFPIRTGDEMHGDIIRAVTQLCDVVLKVESLEQEHADEAQPEDAQ